ncbi:MAG: sulfite exporter TauE/SafE family protein [Hydrogenobaculum sp.]|nr:MAG: sulfite exporter TauE/SafE family protein [Hydrogenobaculum sp.]
MIHYLLAFFSSLFAGGINAVAGGGTLISFPTLIELGLSSKISNTTNTVALWTGSLLGAIGYKSYFKNALPTIRKLFVPSLIGGVLGGFLLLYTPQKTFNFIVPFLILFAAILFSFGPKISRFTSRIKARYIFLIQLITAVYGGYFGAGMGIVMLGSITAIGIDDIHVANTVKNTLAFLINLSAAILFSLYGKVEWHYATIMMFGFAAGGILSSLISQKIDRVYIRMFINIVGYTLAIYYFVKVYIL